MKRKMKFNNKKGFTLIEILIVVAIIGILASIVLVGLGPAQKQGRDVRRISDLKQVQVGLELYFHKCGYYPGDVQATQPCTAFAAAADWAGMTAALVGAGPADTNIGVTAISDDPVRTQHYFYGVENTPGKEGTSYVLGATLEGSNSALDNDIDGTVFGVVCEDPVYCVQL